MNTKQQVATGFIAAIIVGTIAFMPVNAGPKNSHVSVPAPSVKMVASQSSAELSQEQVKDLTYN